MPNLIEKLAAGWALCGGALLLSIMLVTSINVAGFSLDRVARIFEATVPGLSGYEDYVTLAISGAALMFLPYCQLRHGHVTVDLFTSALPPRLQSALDRIWLLAIVLLALFLAYWTTYGMLETRADGALSPVLGWPLWPFYLPGLASLLIWAVVAFAQFTVRELDA